MEEDLNKVMIYLLNNEHESFLNRTKLCLRKSLILQTSELEACLGRLSRSGYIIAFLHPSIGLVNQNSMVPDLKVFYSLSDDGVRFLKKKGGYVKVP